MANIPEASGILVAVGKDRLGLANAVAEFVHSYDCTIDDADMQTLRAYFAILLRFCGTNQAVERVKNDAKRWGDNYGIDIQLYDDLPEDIPPADFLHFDLRVDAIERAGIIDEITRVLHDCDVNIRELESRIKEMPFEASERYVLEAKLQVPASRVECVRDALRMLDLDWVMIFRAS